MTTPILWSKVGVDVQSALGTAVALTTISKASPGVVGSAGHGFNDGDLLLLKIRGMFQLDYMIARVSGKTTDTFALEGVDTTSFDNFLSGTAEKITFGIAASTFQDVNPSGGEADAQLVKTIHVDQDYELPGNLSPLSFGFTSLFDAADPALLALRAFYRTKTPCAIGVRFANGQKVYFAATPSASLAPGGQAGGVVTTPLTLRVRGPLNFYAS